MAESADYGFVLWDGKSPGSISNVITLLKRGRNALVYFAPEKEFLQVTSVRDLERVLSKATPEALGQIDRKVGLEKSISELEAVKLPKKPEQALMDI